MLVKRDLKFAYVITTLVTILLFVSSIVGLVMEGIYGDDPLLLPQLLGQDVVSLALGVPLLVVAMWLTRRGSTRGLLLWAGALFYVVYSYTYYIFGVQFNFLFLVYIAMVSLSLYGLLALLISFATEAIKAQFKDTMPARLIGGFLVAMSLVFALIWLVRIVPKLPGGTIGEVDRLVYVMDLTILLPALCFGGVWLWQRKPWGYALGGLLLVKVVTLGLTLFAMAGFSIRDNQPIDIGFLVVLVVMTLGALVGAIIYFKNIRSSKVQISPAD